MSNNVPDSTDMTGSETVTDFTQIASCSVGVPVERRRQSLRAKLEREQYEREQKTQDSFISTVRNLFK